MQCPRCQGTMIVDHFVDMATSGEIWMPGWRCLMCGEIIDPIIGIDYSSMITKKLSVPFQARRPDLQPRLL